MAAAVPYYHRFSFCAGTRALLIGIKVFYLYWLLCASLQNQANRNQKIQSCLGFIMIESTHVTLVWDGNADSDNFGRQDNIWQATLADKTNTKVMPLITVVINEPSSKQSPALTVGGEEVWNTPEITRTLILWGLFLCYSLLQSLTNFEH